MFSAVFIITYAKDAKDDAKLECSAALQELANSISPVNLVAPVGPYAMNGGDLLFELGFKNEASYRKAKERYSWRWLYALLKDTSVVASFDFVAYGEGKLTLKKGIEAKCHRVLIFEVIEGTDPAMLEKMEKLMPDMPYYIPGLINCKLAKVVESSGSMNWTYAFECDYDDPKTFLTSYNFRPYHWAYVDKFFEPSCTEWVADPNLCTPYCAADRAFLTNYAD